jgi:kinesin family protein 5
MNTNPSECNIKVVARFRPLNPAEERSGSQNIVSFPPGSRDSVNIRGKTYLFDRVFGPSASQAQVYEEAAKPIVKDVLSGYNGTIFAYGQTSSGKTHTMEGAIGDESLEGIIPRIVNDIFQYIFTMEEKVEFHIKVSYFEIYMDKIKDLLDIGKDNLTVHEDKNRVPFVKGATERFVCNPEEVMALIEEGKQNRHISVTNMNEHSSRSHSVFLINVKQENEETQKQLTGKLYLVDLAGSEKVSKTGAEGQTLDEAKNINKSLSALGNVISALADGNKSHIPYRDSKLTRILQESLGGNSRTTIIICGSPASYNEYETKSTLEFGRRAKTIKNTVIVNEVLTAEEWKRRYEKERDKAIKLRSQLSRAEVELSRWRNGEAVPGDEQLDLREQDVSNLSESVQDLNIYQATNQLAGGFSQQMSQEERMRIEEMRARLYAQLDDKEEEISRQADQIDRLKKQLQDQEELLTLTKKRCNQVENDCALSKEEVKRLLAALLEVAQNFDEKEAQLKEKISKIEELTEDLAKSKSSMNNVQGELEQIKESNNVQLRRLSEMLTNFLKELNDIAEVLGTSPASSNIEQLSTSFTDPTTPVQEISNRLEDEFTVARLYINKMKSEVKTLVAKCNQLNSFNEENTKRLQATERELDELKLSLTQHEAKTATLQTSMRDIENKKRTLEEYVDQLREECAKLKAQEEMHIVTSKEREKEKDSVEQIKTALETQIEKHREAHQRQLSELRDEIAAKEAAIEQLKDANQKFVLAQEKNQIDLDRLREEVEQKTAKLNELTIMSDRREQAHEDLKGLQETVTKELQTLNRLRKMFVQDMLTSVKKSKSGEDIDIGGSQIQQEKIAFLENNLDRLTKVHKDVSIDSFSVQIMYVTEEKLLTSTTLNLPQNSL